MQHHGKTAPFRGPEGHLAPDSITEVQYPCLGGLEQRVMSCGESLANPPLVFLHSGPDLSGMRLFRHFNAPPEQSCTVIYWDQRGNGTSYDRKLPRSSMTAEQFIDDLDEVPQHTRRSRAALRPQAPNHAATVKSVTAHRILA